MIKVNKGLSKIKGDIASITAEGVVMLCAISLAVERFGKEFGDAIYKYMLELAESKNVETNENSNVED